MAHPKTRAGGGRILQPLSVPFLCDRCRGETLVVVLGEKRIMDVRPRVCRRGHPGSHRDPSFRRAADRQAIATLPCVARYASICSTRNRPNSDEGDAWCSSLERSCIAFGAIASRGVI